MEEAEISEQIRQILSDESLPHLERIKKMRQLLKDQDQLSPSQETQIEVTPQAIRPSSSEKQAKQSLMDRLNQRLKPKS